MAVAIPGASLALIAEQIAPGAVVVRSWPLRGGISADMTALELQLPGGALRRVVVRRPGPWAAVHDPQAAVREYRVLQIVRSVGVNAPAPLLYDDSGAILPAPYMVVDFIDGEVEHSPGDVGGFVAQIAQEMARIHRVDGTRSELASFPSPDDWLPDARQERAEDDDDALGPRRIRAVLRAAASGPRPVPHPNSPALLHGDPWPGNIIWHHGRLAAMIDWEEAHVGDPLEDLAIARFDVLSMLGWEAMEGLTREYASARPQVDLTDLPYWDLYAALRPSGEFDRWAGGWADLGRPDVTAEVLRTLHREFVAHAFARLVQ
jgi:aminoglycoside phosphotransferase (APT) family kinase protein